MTSGHLWMFKLQLVDECFGSHSCQALLPIYLQAGLTSPADHGKRSCILFLCFVFSLQASLEVRSSSFCLNVCLCNWCDVARYSAAGEPAVAYVCLVVCGHSAQRVLRACFHTSRICRCSCSHGMLGTMVPGTCMGNVHAAAFGVFAAV
jgi:hypothetical protein